MTARAKTLRGNMTDAEARLWYRLRRGQLNELQFRRQHPIGPFTLDFYCASLRLAIEVDGGQHAERRKRTDERWTRWLAEKNVRVIRYWNNDVHGNLEGVLADLVAKVEKRRSESTASPALPLPRGGSADEPAASSGGQQHD